MKGGDNLNRTLEMIMRNLKVEVARIEKENKDLKEQNHSLRNMLIAKTTDETSKKALEVR